MKKRKRYRKNYFQEVAKILSHRKLEKESF
jgi:hypothetical protein